MPDMGDFDPSAMSDMPDTKGSGPDNMPGQTDGSTRLKTYITYGIFLIVMLAAVLISSRIRRRK